MKNINLFQEEISKNAELANHWKVFTSKMNGGAGTLLDGKPVSILGKNFVMGPATICSNALISVGDFANSLEAENLSKYMNTKFFRFMLGIMKISQVLTSNVYKFVPIQDFTSKSDVNWKQSIENIDKQLYKKYKLTKEEIEFIEYMIKPMN
jgi:pheromone shutdown protein TraB